MTCEPTRTASPTPRLVALAALACCCTAQAQGTPAPSGESATAVLETVVVTSRKRPEASQTVPVAISAFSAESLERSKITGAQDLQFSIPNAVLTGNDRFTIRGIGNNSLGGDNGIGLALNGATVAVLPQDELYDMERVEVLRGPQGTLFGRNTTGGALALFTKRPTDQFAASVQVELGNFDHSRLGAMVNIPLGDNIRQRFAGYMLKRDGFTRNETTGHRIDGRDQYSIRSSTRAYIGEATELNLMVSSYREDSSRTRETKRQCKASPVLGCSATELGFDSPDYNATVFKSLAGPLTALGYLKPGFNLYEGAGNPRDLRAVAADYDARFMLHSNAATFEANHDFDAVSLTWTAGYSTVQTEQRTDWDNATLAARLAKPVTYSLSADEIVTTDQIRSTDSFVSRNRTWTHELRLASRGNGAFSYTTGLYQYDSKGGGGFFIYHPFFEIIQKVQGRPAETWFVNTESRNTRTQAWAWFGEGQLRLSESLRATLGARFTKEDRSGEGRSIVLAPTVPFSATPELHDSKWTGRAALDYSPAVGTLFYASVSPGYKGGGFNTGSASSPTFKPETVTAYEVGAKRDWGNVLGGPLRTNVSLFHNQYKDMQLAQRISAAAITANADADIKGAELEVQWAPSRAWLLDAGLSVLKTRIGSFQTIDSANPAQSATATAPTVLVNLEGNQLPHSPKSKVKLGAQYATSLPAGWTLTGRVDHAWQAAYYAREFNAPTDRIGAWSVTNLQLRVAGPNDRLEFKFFVKNLANNDNLTNIIIEDPLVGRYRNVRLLDPRTFGLQIGAKF